MTVPARLPDAASLETVFAGLDPASADTDLVPALTAAFPGFAFGIAPTTTITGAIPDRCFVPTARSSANCGRG